MLLALFLLEGIFVVSWTLRQWDLEPMKLAWLTRDVTQPGCVKFRSCIDPNQPWISLD